MDSEDFIKITFQPSGKRGLIKRGTTLLEAARRLGVDIETTCGGRESCGKCKVRLDNGASGNAAGEPLVSDWAESEQKFIGEKRKRAGYRLACAVRAYQDLVVYVPEESRATHQVVKKNLTEAVTTLNPAVKLYYIETSQPSFDDPLPDLERVAQALENSYGLTDLTVDYHALADLSGALRSSDFKITVAVWNNREIIAFRPGRRDNYYGLAVDIGTTTIAAYLLDMVSMEIIGAVSMMNPQVKYGEDLISRIAYCQDNRDGLAKLRGDVVEGLNKLVSRSLNLLSKQTSPKADGPNDPTAAAIMDMTVVCNTAMSHIFLNLNPTWLALAPFTPTANRSLNIKARDLGIRINPGSYVFVLPNEAGFVGADNVGALIAEEPLKEDRPQLIIDIGTNGELALSDGKTLLTASCATGPALEGAQLSFGMRAAPGAIERLRIDPVTHDVDYKAIGDHLWKSESAQSGRVKGICGSGIIDAVAQFFLTGIINKSGAFCETLKTERFRRGEQANKSEFVLAWKEETSIGADVVVTQQDIRQIQLAKGALYCGCKLLMRRLGMDKVDRIKIAGAFGSHIDPLNALIIGMFPDLRSRVGQGRGQRRRSGGVPGPAQRGQTRGSRLGGPQGRTYRTESGTRLSGSIRGSHAVPAHVRPLPQPERDHPGD